MNKIGVVYTRASTLQQDQTVQRSHCADYAYKHGIVIMQYLEDNESGATQWQSRRIALALAEGSTSTDILVYEYSRIGRGMMDTLSFIDRALAQGKTVHIVRSGQKIEPGIMGRIFSVVMAMVSEIERDLIRTRTFDTLENRRDQIKHNGGFMSKAGVWRTRLGRPTAAVSQSKIASHTDAIANLLRAKVPRAAIARILDCDVRTVDKLINNSEQLKELL